LEKYHIFFRSGGIAWVALSDYLGAPYQVISLSMGVVPHPAGGALGNWRSFFLLPLGLKNKSKQKKNKGRQLT